MCLGIPGQIVEMVDPVQHRAIVNVEGVRREVSVALLNAGEGADPVTVGDWVLIHVGFAMAQIDEQEAADTLAALHVLGSVYDEELAQFSEAGGP